MLLGGELRDESVRCVSRPVSVRLADGGCGWYGVRVYTCGRTDVAQETERGFEHCI